jgi:hypothetical protein
MSPRLAVAALFAVMLTPILLAGFSPYLPSRSLPYLIGGFAGIAALAVLVIQPLLAANALPGLAPATSRRWHLLVGAVLATCIALHIGGLYVTSPEDTLDALLLVSPTPFSVYGVLATAAVIATLALVALRRRFGAVLWANLHNALAVVIVAATVTHAVQIDGAMEPTSKFLLCAAALLATAITVVKLRLLRPLARWRKRTAASHRP